MVILQIFNKYQKPGGEEASVLRVADTLEKSHKVIRCYFDSKDWATRSGVWKRLRQALSMLWNPSAIKRVRRQIDEHQPDLILLHNIFPICSAATLFMLVRGRTPVVQYVHNFRPFSVNGYLWGSKGLLDQGLDKNFIPEILDGAWQDSKVRTAWYAMILWCLHLTGTFRKIDRWIAISGFMQRKFIEAGIPPRRVEMLRHSWDPSPRLADEAVAEEPDGNPPYILFLGRLSSAKGVDVLLDAWNMAKPRLRSGKLVIGGEGPMEQLVIHAANTDPSIEFRGHVTGEEKFQLLRGSRAVVAPSVWWEPLGIVVFEAYDHAKPALVASSGGLTETVIHEQTGLLHSPGDAIQFADHIARVMEDRAYAHKLGLQGKSHLLQTTDPAIWSSQMEEILHDVIRLREQDTGLRGDQTSPSDVFTVPRSANRHTSSTALQSATLPQTTIDNSRSTISISTYLADQNPGHDRSFGISRMSRLILETLQTGGGVSLRTIASETSQQAPTGVGDARILPWGTRRKWVRLLTDHFYPLFANRGDSAGVHYFPKGYLPLLSGLCRPSVVTIHDTIIQYDEDRYPDWRSRWEYSYWCWMLKHTLRRADVVLTVSESAKNQIQAFMDRHTIAPKEITVTFEPCVYEALPQPVEPKKKNYVIHLASCEPHKRTAHLIRWWCEAEARGGDLPMLHLIGTAPAEVHGLLASSRSIVKLPFLEEGALQAAYQAARALILPSEIEGFGLPALEAYYLGTPVCFVRGTSVEEVLSVATSKGGFRLEDLESLETALAEVMAMTVAEVRDCGLKLRETYAAEKVVARMLAVFEKTGKR